MPVINALRDISELANDNKKYQDRAAIADRLILTFENKTDITTS
jgi:hypothetical protein